MEEKELLKEIKALLEEQNRLLAGYQAKTNWRFWIVLAVLLLLLFIPNLLAR